MNSPEPQLTDQLWTSLKMLIILLAVLAPVLIAFLSIRFKRMKKQLIKQYQGNKKLVEKRIQIYDRIGPKLNDIVCFFSYTGNWKKLTPEDMIRLKRDLDKDISTNMPVFSGDLSQKYNAFMQLCFVAFSGWEHEEKIKSLYELRKEHNPEWNDDWIPFFDSNNVVEGIRVKERYDELMGYFRRDLSL